MSPSNYWFENRRHLRNCKVIHDAKRHEQKEHDGQRKGQTSPGLRGSPQINICTNKTIAIIDLSKNGGNFNKVNRVVIFKFIH